MEKPHNLRFGALVLMLVMVNQINDPLIDPSIPDALLFWIVRPLALFLGLWIADAIVSRMQSTALARPEWLKPVVIVSLLGLLPLTLVEVLLEQHLPFRAEFLDEQLWSLSPLLAFVSEYVTLATILLPIHFMLWLVTGRRKPETGELSASETSEPAFLNDYPSLKAEHVRALQAEEHYVRVYKDSGSVLIQARFRDAVEQMPETLGIRAHRSWWAADRAVVSASRGKRRWQLMLDDGVSIPVSDTYLSAVRSRGWLKRKAGS